MESALILPTITLSGAAASLVVLVCALFAGRSRPVHHTLWIVALIITVVPALFISFAAVGATITAGASWVLFGAIGLWLLVALTWIRPTWAGWTYLATALAIPIAIAIGQAVLAPDPPMEVDAGMVFGFYGIRSLVTATLLLWPRRASSADEAQLPNDLTSTEPG